jgi:hypothetical protein
MTGLFQLFPHPELLVSQILNYLVPESVARLGVCNREVTIFFDELLLTTRQNKS